jgi:hypothetical protein
MTKTIDTLIPDIERMLDGAASGADPVPVTETDARTFGENITKVLQRQLTGRVKKSRTGEKVLRMSELGKPCHRQLWYEYHTPEAGEPMPGHTIVKFLFGDIIEEVALLLAKLAGHEVKHEQEAIEFERNGWTIRGHQDAIIDDALVDVKSASGYGTQKFKDGLTDQNDAFGYRGQLSSYMLGQHPDVKRMGFLVKNKENGRLLWSETPYQDPLPKIDALINDLEQPAPPPRAFSDVPEGKSGNRKLDTACSYCAFKQTCWPNLRGFAYAKGPVWLTNVCKTPDVMEFTKGPSDGADSSSD